MLAYALAGASPLVGVADPSEEKTLGSNFSEFVEVPLDVVMAYWFRANQLRFHGSRRVMPTSVVNGSRFRESSLPQSRPVKS